MKKVADQDEKLKLTIPAKAEYLSLLRLVVSAVAEEMGFADEGIADIKVALSEASTNIVRHAYNNSHTYNEKTIEVVCFDRKGCLLIEITDRGHGMSVPPPPSEGLGFGIMGSLMDKVDVETGSSGTVVLLEKDPSKPRK